MQKPLPFPELEEERDRAERVKQDTPVLVIIGNPPYNGFAGVAVDEERELSQAYRTTRQVRRPEGQGLNDLYVRFFRMAERRIAEKTGRGVVCYVSNYSWLDGLSFTGMREHFLDAFDAIRIDNLHGDKYKTGKTTPDGAPDPSIFSTPDDPVGIQVGTAIATLVRKDDHAPAQSVGFRHLWGQAKHAELTATAEAAPDALYDEIAPLLPLGLPFADLAVSDGWQHWPSLPDLFPTSLPGATTGRDSFLVDIDLNRLRARIHDYYNSDLSHDEIARRYPSVMRTSAHFNARRVRDTRLVTGGPDESGFIRYAYRPFDTRWLYWEGDTGLLDRPRPDYKPHIFDGNLWIEARHRESREAFSRGTVVRHLAGDFGNGRSHFFPMWLRDDTLRLGGDGAQRRPNLSPSAQNYLDLLGLSVDDLFHHVIAVLHDPQYRASNAGALRMEWPRIPLPGWSAIGGSATHGNGDTSGDSDSIRLRRAADELAASAARGRQLAALLDSDTPVAGVTSGTLTPAMAAIAVPAIVQGSGVQESGADGGNMAGDDFAVTAGWGHHGSGDAVMPGQGRVVERDYTAAERATLSDLLPTLGETTYDIYLNERAYWRNVPASVWNYQLGGYQVLKKWLSYREQRVLGRALTVEEVQAFAETARRVAAILSLGNGA